MDRELRSSPPMAWEVIPSWMMAVHPRKNRAALAAATGMIHSVIGAMPSSAGSSMRT